jgi:hypothetical protein
VEGGKKHDYIFHGQGTRLTTEGLSLEAARPGSLAGPDVDWGARLGVDGDVIGIANKPYWNPPPGNGFGFLLAPRPARPDGAWSAEWRVGDAGEPRLGHGSHPATGPRGGTADSAHPLARVPGRAPGPARLRLTMLPTAPAEVVVVEAPGIYPRLPRASYVLARRAGAGPASVFAALLEPYGEERAVRRVTSLAPAPSEAGAPVVAKVTLADGRTDYLLHADPGASHSWKYGERELRFAGGFGKARVDARGLADLALVGGTSLSAAGVTVELAQAAYEGRIERIDFENNLLYTRVSLPEGEVLASAFISLGGREYAQRSAYRIASVTREGAETAIQLAPTTLILGRGHLDEAPPDERTLPNVVPLEYAKSLGRKPAGSGFFRGKSVATPDGRARTRIRAVAGDTGMAMTVASARGFRAGDDLVIYDVQPGDPFRLPCWAYLERQADGRLRVRSNAPLTVTQNGRRSVLPPGENTL